MSILLGLAITKVTIYLFYQYISGASDNANKCITISEPFFKMKLRSQFIHNIHYVLYMLIYIYIICKAHIHSR